jgi:uncharacterized protein
MTEKHYVSPVDLRNDSFRLGALVYASGFRPDFMVALWRGGASIGCYVQEILEYIGLDVDHIAVRTSKYKGVDQASSTVKVHNLGYLTENLKKSSKLLIVDDIFDTGLSVEALISALMEKLGDEMPSVVKIATLYDKPSRNKSGRHPDYFIHHTDKWVVFPHELNGLSKEEIFHNMGDVASTLEYLGVFHGDFEDDWYYEM